jgi:hypothetical protein
MRKTHIKDFHSFVRESVTPATDITIGSKGEHVKALQEALESIGFKLNRYGIDSKFGFETLGQVKSLFHIANNTPSLKSMMNGNTEIANNTVTTEQQEMVLRLAEAPSAKTEVEEIKQEFYSKLSDKELIAKDLIVANNSNPEAFIQKLMEVSGKLGINPNWLLLVMWKESKLDPKAVNSTSGASGLIQFMPSTAEKTLRVSIDAIRRMDGVQQLDYVYEYFKSYTGRINSVEDLYLITFYPVALGRGDDTPLGGRKVAKQNKVIDLNRDNQLTVGEFKDYVMKDVPNDYRQGLA